jgi:hypothetical protein
VAHAQQQAKIKASMCIWTIAESMLVYIFYILLGRKLYLEVVLWSAGYTKYIVRALICQHTYL